MVDLIFGGVAREAYYRAREIQRGLVCRVPTLLTPGTANAKTAKSAGEAETAILHLAPYTLAYPRRNVCPHSTPGCRAGCLNTAGRGQIRGAVFQRAEPPECRLMRLLQHPIHRARIARTRFFWDLRETFLICLAGEIEKTRRRAVRRNVPAAVRLNGTADLPWERFPLPGAESIFHAFPTVQFWDYTKSYRRAVAFAGDPAWPQNYHLTFSYSEKTTPRDLVQMIDKRVSVAVVFAGDLPEFWDSVRVIDGDASDLRWRDPRGCIVGLRAKGKAKNDRSGFVIQDPYASIWERG